MTRSRFLSRVCVMAACAAAVAMIIYRTSPSRAQTTTTQAAGIALSKNAQGQVIVHSASAYKTGVLGKTVQMASLPLSLYLAVTPNTHCDELYKVLNGKLYCAWNTTLRIDEGGFGVHSGTFEWDDGVGDVFQGTMQGTIGCGTHRLPAVHDGDSTTENCEECRTALHFEGTMTGNVVSGPLKTQYHNMTIGASYAGSLISSGGLTAIKDASMSIDGMSFVPGIAVK